MTFGTTRENKVLPSQMTYGDVRVKSLEDIGNFHRLNRRQRHEIKWIADNHLNNYCELQDVSSDNFHHSLTVNRIGSSVDEHWIVVTSSIRQIVGTQLKHRETRHIRIGIRGGKYLLNPDRRGQYVTGKAVLRVPAKSGL